MSYYGSKTEIELREDI